ncbi:hypothetical protein JCM3770_006426 [Rhodotorula araucariae]
MGHNTKPPQVFRAEDKEAKSRNKQEAERKKQEEKRTSEERKKKEREKKEKNKRDAQAAKDAKKLEEDHGRYFPGQLRWSIRTRWMGGDRKSRSNTAELLPEFVPEGALL